MRLKMICQLAAEHQAHSCESKLIDVLFTCEKFDLLATNVVYCLGDWLLFC